MRVHCPNQHTAEAMAFIRTDPEIEGFECERTDLVIEPVHDFLRLVLPDAVVEGSAPVLMDELHRYHFVSTLADHPGATIIHGGTLACPAGHILFIGDKGVGKTTLLLYLAAHGWPVAGDEHVILDGPYATPRPRSFRVKQGSLNYLPRESADIVLRSPWLPDWNGSPVYSVSPTEFGQRWQIAARPVSHVVMLTKHHGGRSQLRRIEKDAALEQTLPNVLLPANGRAAALGALRAMVSNASCWGLRSGRLEDSKRLLYPFISDANEAELTRGAA